MKQSLSSFDFVDAFRTQRPDQFSYEALHALFDYFEESENYTGEEMELDVIAICCEYSEGSLHGINTNYSLVDIEDYTNEDTKEVDYAEYNEAIHDELTANTTVLLLGDFEDEACMVVYQDY